jgi:hypothetical protein
VNRLVQQTDEVMQVVKDNVINNYNGYEYSVTSIDGEWTPSFINNNNGYEYSVTSIDGEWALLFRSAYHVDRMYRIVRRPRSSTVPCRLAYRVKGLYRVGKILSSIVLGLYRFGKILSSIVL